MSWYELTTGKIDPSTRDSHDLEWSDRQMQTLEADRKNREKKGMKHFIAVNMLHFCQQERAPVYMNLSWLLRMTASNEMPIQQ